jgi:hypothetical protein
VKVDENAELAGMVTDPLIAPDWLAQDERVKSVESSPSSLSALPALPAVVALVALAARSAVVAWSAPAACPATSALFAVRFEVSMSAFVSESLRTSAERIERHFSSPPGAR